MENQQSETKIAWIRAFGKVMGPITEADLERRLAITPYEGSGFGRAGWVLSLVGSPPRMTVIIHESASSATVVICINMYGDVKRSRGAYSTYELNGAMLALYNLSLALIKESQ
jgi:hypothetical protein